LLREARVLSSTLKGGRSFALSELAELPDEQLKALIPLVRPVFDVFVEGERLVARHKEAGSIIELGPATREQVMALNLLAAETRLEVAGRRMARQMGWQEERGFAYVKDLFLSLVAHLVCVPLNSPDLDGDDSA
jgi:hypothetical protein